MAEHTLDLFECLQEKIGCAYISDLPFVSKQNPEIIVHTLRSISPSDYPLKQWNDLLDYLAKVPAQQTAEDAYALLISTLSAPAEVR